LRRIFYRYLLVSNSVTIATDLATEMFLDFKLEITVSKSVSKATKILVANYRSLIRSHNYVATDLTTEYFLTLALKISVSKSVALIFRSLNQLVKANFPVVIIHSQKNLKK
jgi:hypothetical protein